MDEKPAVMEITLKISYSFISMIKKTVLKNNIVLVTEKNSASRSCAIGFWFNVGSRYEEKNHHGISHLTEHLLFKGTASKTNREISCLFDRMGAVLNAFTERENVCLYSIVPDCKDNVEKALATLCDMAEHSTFPIEEFEKEKKVVESEIAALEDDSDESALDEVAGFVWKDDSLSLPIGGTCQEVENLSVEDVKLWYEKYFVNGELSIFISGSFDEEKIVSIIESMGLHKEFPEYPLKRHFSGSVEWNAGWDFAVSDFSQSQIYIMYPFEMPMTEKESYALAVFNALTGDTMSSRFFDVLREKNALCYSVFSFFTFYENAAAWCACASCEEKNVVKTAVLLQKEIEKLCAEGLTDEEVEAAREHVAGEELLASCDMEYLLKRNQKNFSLGIPLKTTDEVVECIRNIEKNDIMELMQRLLNESKKAVIVYGPKLKSKQKKEMLCQTK